MGTPDVIKNHNKPGLREFLILFHTDSSQFNIQKFPIAHIRKEKVINNKDKTFFKNKKMIIRNNRNTLSNTDSKDLTAIY